MDGQEGGGNASPGWFAKIQRDTLITEQQLAAGAATQRERVLPLVHFSCSGWQEHQARLCSVTYAQGNLS